MDVVIVGGCGRVGFPLGLAFASKGLKTCLYDLNTEAVENVNLGKMPFAERGAAEVLSEVTDAGLLVASSDPSVIGDAPTVVLVIGTPVDGQWNLFENGVQV